MYDNKEKAVQLLKPIAPSIIHPQLDSWLEKRDVWAKLELTSPLCSVKWSEKASILEIVQAHADAMIKLMGRFEKGDAVLNLWESLYLAMRELVEALVIVKYHCRELDASLYVNVMVKVQEEYEQRFNALERGFFGHPKKDLLYSQYLRILKDQRAKVDGHFVDGKALLLVAQNYNLLSKLSPQKHYSETHLDALNHSCAKLLAGFPAQTPYGRVLRLILRKKMKALRFKWVKQHAKKSDIVYLVWHSCSHAVYYP